MAAVVMMTATDLHNDSRGTRRSRRGDDGGGAEQSGGYNQWNQKFLHG